MPGPNPEQLKAIEHQGGALLSAGAGSGKTFVLAEHLIYLAKRWLSEFSPDTDPDFGQYIKSKLSKVVLMTFTKKAAGEIGIRIRDNFHKAQGLTRKESLYGTRPLKTLTPSLFRPSMAIATSLLSRDSFRTSTLLMKSSAKANSQKASKTSSLAPLTKLRRGAKGRIH